MRAPMHCVLTSDNTVAPGWQSITVSTEPFRELWPFQINRFQSGVPGISAKFRPNVTVLRRRLETIWAVETGRSMGSDGDDGRLFLLVRRRRRRLGRASASLLQQVRAQLCVRPAAAPLLAAAAGAQLCVLLAGEGRRAGSSCAFCS